MVLPWFYPPPTAAAPPVEPDPPAAWLWETTQLGHHPFGNGLSDLFMGIWEMVYDCFNHMMYVYMYAWMDGMSWNVR